LDAIVSTEPRLGFRVSVAQRPENSRYALLEAASWCELAKHGRPDFRSITIGRVNKTGAGGHMGIEDTITWVAAKGSLPIIGPRPLAQLENNLAAAR
jgi:hypothetical protein